MTKTATVNLFANAYEVDQALVGTKVELLFDPFDLSEIRVRYHGREMGRAVPLVIGRHVHPKAKADPVPAPKPTTGIDYLKMIEERHSQETRRAISYSDLPTDEPSEDPMATNDEADEGGRP